MHGASLRRRVHLGFNRQVARPDRAALAALAVVRFSASHELGVHDTRVLLYNAMQDGSGGED